jgi:hypothetical protein
MGRSQVLYNRTKGRFRNKVREHQAEQSRPHSDQHPRGYHNDQPRQERGGNNSYDSSHGKNADASYKKRTRTRSSIGQHTNINESEMLLLADSAAPQYYVEDDSSTLFGGKDNKQSDSFATSASSLDIASLETTLLTCVSIADRLKLPSHVARSLQKEGSSTVVTTTISSSNSGFTSKMGTSGVDARGHEDSEDIVRNARIRKHLFGEFPPTTAAFPPTNIASPELLENGSKGEDSFLASLSLADDDESSAADVIRSSYSGIQERGRVNLPAAPSLVYGTSSSILHHKYNNSNKKKETDDASYSIGPNKIKATEEGDIEVRMKKDDASRQSREFDVGRYAVIDEDDEDSFMTSDHSSSDAKQRLPNNMRNVHVPKTRNSIAGVSAGTGKLDPPTTTRDPPADVIPPLNADPSADSEMLENWLDDVVGEDAASSAAVHPIEAKSGQDAMAANLGRPTGNKKGHPSSVQGFVGTASKNVSTTMTQATAMPKEVTIPHRPMVSAPKATLVVDPGTMSPQEDVEDTLESWLDDVIM